MSDVYVCMRKHARQWRSGGMFLQEIFKKLDALRSTTMALLLSQNGLRSNIASEAILGQKRSRSSYIAHGVLHLIFGCACMHLLTGGG